MKFYITEETRQEIEAKIAEFEEDKQFWLNNSIKNIGNPAYNSLMASINQAKAEQAAHLLREILSSATILPVEESWESVQSFINSTPISEILAEGVIIQPKK